MSINFLRLNNFRIFQKITLEFEKPLIFIHGNNRSGKTSIIEAIYIILNNRSFRCDSLAGCVKNGERFFSIETKDSDIDKKILYSIDGNKFYFENDEKKSFPLLKNKTFLFYNKSILNFIFTRETRRKTIDELISLIDQQYFFSFINYKKLYQKKKEIIYSNLQYDIKFKLYEEMIDKLANFTYELYTKRKQYIKLCNEFLSRFETYFIEYKSSFDNLDPILIKDLYINNFKNEINCKKYLGPHNDIYILKDDTGNLSNFGSSSDFYKFYFYLNLYFIQKCKEIFDSSDIKILFDDFFLSLDKSSINSLLNNFSNSDNIFISQHDYFETDNFSFQSFLIS